MAFHPDPVPVIDEEFGPSADGVERAGQLVATFESAHAEGVMALRTR